MGVALDDLETGGKGRFIERIGELAEAAADAGDEATLAQFATPDEASGLRRAANLAPEAEQAPSRYLDAVKTPDGAAQIMDLAGGERPVLLALERWPGQR